MAPSHDRLASARTYIAIAESEDSKREAYTAAADEIIAWLAEDPTRSGAQAAKEIGKSKTQINDLVRWRTNGRPVDLPYGGDERQESRDASATRKTLRERPEVVVEALDSLSSEQLDSLADDLVESPVMTARVETALGRKKAKPIPESDNTPREPLHWMLTKLATLFHGHERFIKEDGERCIELPLELRTAGSVVIEDGVALVSKFREALEAETLAERKALLAEAMTKKTDVDAAIDQILEAAR